MTSSVLRAEAIAGKRREVRIAVFAKAPRPGEVKTRLAPLLGPEGAARLHGKLVRQALGTAADAGVGPLELWCAPDANDAFFLECAREFGATLHVQQGTGLGERMLAAFGAALEENAPLVLIGGDCPGLTPLLLRDAAAALGEYDAVVAPAEDGGYVLLGLARPMPELFAGIPWGGPLVMARTRERLSAAGARWRELETLWDIDRPEDYARLEREGLLRAS